MTETELRDALAVTTPGLYGPTGPPVYLPAGTIYLTQPLVISNRAHCKLVGAGRFATQIVGTVVFEQCLECHVEGMTINGAGGEVGLSIRNAATPPNWPISSDNRIKDVSVVNAVNGIFIDSRLRDANNEFHLFENVQVSNCVEAGFRIWGSQCHRIQFRRCNAMSCKWGLYAERGNYWHWTDGQCTGNDVDFVVGSFWVETLIDRHRSEGSKSLYLTSGEWSPMSVTFRNITWDGLPVPGGADTVNVQSNGPIRFESVQLSGTNGVTPSVTVFDHDPGSVDIAGLTITTYSPPENDTKQKPVRVAGHLQLREFGVSERILPIGGGNIERQIIIRPPDDVMRGRIPLVVPRESYAYGYYYDRVPSPLPLAATQGSRSFAVAFTVTFDAVTHNHHMLVANGVGFRILNYPDKWQWRAEWTGGSIDDPTVEAGVPYRVAVSIDRDTRSGLFRVGATVIPTDIQAFGTQQDIDNSLRTSDWSWATELWSVGSQGNPGGGRFAGSITDAYCWDRSLSAEEIAVA
jgi:hypothetical protein